MTNPFLDIARDYRLLNASITASGIQPNGQLIKYSEFYDPINFRSDPQCFVGGANGINAALLGEVEDNRYILAFRGTISPPDSLDCTDLCNDWEQSRNFKPVPWQTASSAYGHVAEGFANALLTLWPQIYDVLGPLLNARKPEIWITGHSKGGAMAILAASLLKRAHGTQPRAYRVTVSGAPMVGQSDFMTNYVQDGLLASTLRYQNEFDLVPRYPDRPIPPAILPPIPAIGFPGCNCSGGQGTLPAQEGYRHVGLSVFVTYLTNGGVYDARLDDNSEQDYLATVHTASVIDDPLFVGQAHNPKGNYLACLKALKP